VPKRTRNRQLARLAARRQAEKHHRQRQRQLGTIAVALVVALVGGGFLASTFIFGGQDTAPQASGPTGLSGLTGPSGPSGASPSPSVEGELGTVTGKVDPEPGPDAVACGGQTPETALDRKPQFNAPADVLKPGRTYTATFRTSCGDIVIELLADQAPATVNSFVFLAEQGYFDATRIHRLDTSIDVIQGGDPTGTGTGSPGYSIPDELVGGESYVPGTLAMANSGAPNSGGSQFFLITGPNGTNLDANPAYTIFGRVIEGLDVAQRIQGLPIRDAEAAAAGDISGQQPRQAVYIETVTISSERPEG
jgi:cyclophilin family peptidyl-prolyl cis-trans isomerase